MKTLGQLVLEDILLDRHADHILYAPHGWLEDSSFPKVAEELGITLISAPSWTPKEQARVEEELAAAPRGPSRNRVLLVETRADAQQWSRELEGKWKVITRQAIDVFPTLDPELTQHLAVSQVNQLLPSYGRSVVPADESVRGPRRTARTLIDELYGIDATTLGTVQELIENALRLHLRGASLHPSWVHALADDIASLEPADLDPVEILTELDALVTAIAVLVDEGELVEEQWAATVKELLAIGATPTEGSQQIPSPADRWKNLNPDHIATEVLAEDWGALELSSWADRSALLTRLALATEIGQTQELDEARKKTDDAFAEALGDYTHLLYSPRSRRPPLVHTIPDFLATKHGDERVALLVVDCLSLPLWSILRDVLKQDHGIEPSWETTTFAWIPTLTTISRQALLSGKKPSELGDQLKSTYGEAKAWTTFWEDRGLPSYAAKLVKTVDKEDRWSTAQEACTNPDLRRLGLVFNKVDNLIHAATSANISFSSLVHDLLDSWLPDTFVPLLDQLLSEGWTTYVTSDHGAHKMTTALSNPREGILVESRGQRVRLYARDEFAQNPDVEGTRWQDQGTLPDDMVAVLAPAGTGYGTTGWGHGGAAWDEVLVPFVRYGGDR